ncbi:MAG: LIC_12708 family protein [Treponema sp.]
MLGRGIHRCLQSGVVIVVLLLLVVSCRKNHSTELERQELFTLDYGSFENQIDLFHLESAYTRPDSQLYMQDGIFYVSNSYAGKVLQLTSFGDLLALYYNPEKNDAVTFSSSDEKDKLMTRRAVAYPLNHPTYLTVNSKKRLFVADMLPEERVEYDQAEDLALRNSIVCFNESGDFVDSLGQEGWGGSPFPPIEGLYTTSHDNLVVICRTDKSSIVYWYDSSGNLLYKIPLVFSMLPSPYSSDQAVFSSLDKAVPDFNSEKLYVKVDYYREEIDASSKVSAGVNYDTSYLYVFDIAPAHYEQKIEIKPYESVEETAAGSVHFEKVYNLLGVTAQNWCFLTTPVADGYLLKLMDLSSNKMYLCPVKVSYEELAYNAFSLSSTGILSALITRDDQAAVVWWRTDSIVGVSGQ